MRHQTALELIAAEDERQTKLHDLLETIREQIRTGIEPGHRPEGLFKNIQDAVYAMRGRTPLLNDAVIVGAFDALHAQGVTTNLPRKLTAENGAKYALSGEFYELFDMLDEDGEETSAMVPVTWDTIKRIWDKAVEHFDAHPVAPAERQTIKADDLIPLFRDAASVNMTEDAVERQARRFAEAMTDLYDVRRK